MKTNILIIDDDEEMCEEISEILEDEGYSTQMACNGLDGINLIEKNKYDLLLLDLKIPGLTGYEVLQIVKRDFKDLKVIVLTGSPLIEIMSEDKPGLETRKTLLLADGLMNKPYDIGILLSKIAELTGARK